MGGLVLLIAGLTVFALAYLGTAAAVDPDARTFGIVVDAASASAAIIGALLVVLSIDRPPPPRPSRPARGFETTAPLLAREKPQGEDRSGPLSAEDVPPAGTNGSTPPRGPVS